MPFGEPVPAPNSDPASVLCLAELLRDEKQYEEAQRWSESLITDGWDDPKKSSLENAIRVIKAHWVVATWLGKSEAVKLATDWRSSGTLRPTLGCVYVDTIRRSLEQNYDIPQVESLVAEALQCLDEIFTSDGHQGPVVHEAFKVIDEIARILRRFGLSNDCNTIISKFIDANFIQMCAEHHEWSIDDPEIKEWLASFRALECVNGDSNPLTGAKWSHFFEEPGDEQLEQFGYIPVNRICSAKGKPRRILWISLCPR